MTSTIDIRVLTTIEEMNEMQQLENAIWSGEGGIPVHQTITAVRNGGLAIGAYDQGQLVGFSYGFPGFKDGKVYLCSHNMGIHPEYRDAGIGASLKNKQKEEAAKLGYDMLTWTYDPLETRNGYLNLSKLRAICSIYVENSYGIFEEGINKGLPTDRFKVEWWIHSRHVAERKPVSFKEGAERIPWKHGQTGPVLVGDLSVPEADEILVPVPKAFQSIKLEDMELAMDWRMKTRELFTKLFGQGYTAVSLVRSEEGPVHHYLLVKRSELDL
ncbi:GNAT family N-acetyltransferase [Siminovitchia sediminis]|uniref:GNAT family N-acetyltransferase n=1 Tax=Siminovitchia sediminis TaxID=1274353 RepID=A0ABW4KG68_9BACI